MEEKSALLDTADHNPGNRPVSRRVRLPGRIVSLHLTALLALALLPYLQVLWHSFIDFDDQLYVTQSYQVRSGLSLETLSWASTAIVAANWHPLTLLSHALDCTVFGIRPAGHYATNLVLHATNCLLLYLLLYRSTRDSARAFFVAALFAVHPFNVETVAWIASRKGLLSTCFSFLSLLAYVSYVRSRRLRSYLLVVAASVLALMAKPMAVTLPFVMLLLDYWPLARLTVRPRRRLTKIVVEKIPLLALAAASSWLTYAVHSQVRSFHHFSVGARVANALTSYVDFILKTIWPTGMCVYYPHPGENINWPSVAAAALLLIAVTAIAIRFASSRPSFLVGWFWFLGMLLPVIGLVPVDGNSMADRYAYVPLVGLFIAAAWIWPDPVEIRPLLRKCLIGLFLGVLVALSVCTWQQARYWRNSKTLFERALAVTHQNAFAEGALGDALLQDGDTEGAVLHLTKALAAEPRLTDALNSLGVAFLRQGQTEKAVRCLQEVVKRAPRTPAFRSNLGEALLQRNQTNEAYQQFQQASASDPRLPQALLGMGRIDLRNGNIQKAVDAFRKASLLNPTDAFVQNGLGVALVRHGQPLEALAHFQLAVALQPGAENRNNLAMLLMQVGRFREAEKQFREILSEQPGRVPVRIRLGLSLGRQGKVDEAIREFEEILRTDPQNVDALYNLAIGLAQLGKFQEGLRYAEQAYHLDPLYSGLKETLDKLNRSVTASGPAKKK